LGGFPVILALDSSGDCRRSALPQIGVGLAFAGPAALITCLFGENSGSLHIGRAEKKNLLFIGGKLQPPALA